VHFCSLWACTLLLSPHSEFLHGVPLINLRGASHYDYDEVIPGAGHAVSICPSNLSGVHGREVVARML
jgi:hypothetical protein